MGANAFRWSAGAHSPALRKSSTAFVPDDVKGRRLQEVIDQQMKHAGERNRRHVGQVQEVLIEGVSKRSEAHLFGRNSQNAVVIVARHHAGTELKPGDLVLARIVSGTSGSLQGEVTEVVARRPEAMAVATLTDAS